MKREFIHKRMYQEWMEKEGIPIYQGVGGVEDPTELPRRPWARLGGLGTFIELEGTKQRGHLIYVVEIPAGGTLEPEKHLCNELIYILQGRGLAEVWHEGQGKVTFEWGERSLFAIPLNAWHRLVNGGRQPVLILAVTAIPIAIEFFRNTEFIFNCDYNFTDRFTGKSDYFVAEKRYKEGSSNIWETNFVPDALTAFLDVASVKGGPGAQGASLKMAAWPGGSHISAWPVGRYVKAHYHYPGAVFLGLVGEGYSLIWEKEYGIHPFQDGHGDKVVKVDWKPSSVFALFGNEVFHAHYNTGRETARHMPLYDTESRFPGYKAPTRQIATLSIREGGQMLEYEDEDPEIRRMFQEELQKKGIKFVMPPVVYRTDSFTF